MFLKRALISYHLFYDSQACKSMLVLNNYGHLQKEADVRNFMAYASKELKNIP